MDDGRYLADWQWTARSVLRREKECQKKNVRGICRMFGDSPRRLAGSTRLSIYSRMYSRFNCHCVSVDPARSAASRSEKSSSRNNYGPIVTGPDLHQTTTQYPIRKRNRKCICHLFFRLCPAARDDIRTSSLLAWASYLDSCRIVSRPSIIDASCRLFDIDVHKCILSSR